MGIRAIQQHMAIIGALILALCLLALLSAAGPAQADPLPEDLVPGEDFADGQVVVKLNPESDATIDDINDAYNTTVKATLPNYPGVYLLKIKGGSSVIDVLRRMLGDQLDPSNPLDQRLEYAEPNFLAATAEADDHGGDGRFKARNEGKVGEGSPQYAADALGLPCAHDVSRGEGVTVAVLDTGAQLDHPALKSNFKGVKRYDFVGNDKKPWDRKVRLDEDGDGVKDEMAGHGTHVAGIVDLVAPKAKIMPLRVLNSEGSGKAFTIAKGISYAQSKGANVINLSLGSPHKSELLQEVIEGAIGSGVVAAAAAGNDNSLEPHYPAAGDGTGASVDGLLAVTAVDKDEQRKWSEEDPNDGANYGPWVDIAAPGVDIRSTYPVSEYADWSGTSMATPFVAGQAALIHDVESSLDPMGVEGVMYDSARSLEATEPVYYSLGWLGEGHADVGASLNNYCSQVP